MTTNTPYRDYINNLKTIDLPICFLPPVMIAFRLFSLQIFKPTDGKTFCNKFVAHYFDILGSTDFNDIPANEFWRVAKYNPKFTQYTLEQWLTCSDKNKIGFAEKSATPHGHVVVLLDGKSSFSPSFKAVVPHCCDVGKNYNWDVPISRAFKSMPTIWRYMPAITPLFNAE